MDAVGGQGTEAPVPARLRTGPGLAPRRPPPGTPSARHPAPAKEPPAPAPPATHPAADPRGPCQHRPAGAGRTIICGPRIPAPVPGRPTPRTGRLGDRRPSQAEIRHEIREQPGVDPVRPAPAELVVLDGGHPGLGTTAEASQHPGVRIRLLQAVEGTPCRVRAEMIQCPVLFEEFRYAPAADGLDRQLGEEREPSGRRAHASRRRAVRKRARPRSLLTAGRSTAAIGTLLASRAAVARAGVPGSDGLAAGAARAARSVRDVRHAREHAPPCISFSARRGHRPRLRSAMPQPGASNGTRPPHATPRPLAAAAPCRNTQRMAAERQETPSGAGDLARDGDRSGRQFFCDFSELHLERDGFPRAGERGPLQGCGARPGNRPAP